jgi:hypothetical protein
MFQAKDDKLFKASKHGISRAIVAELEKRPRDCDYAVVRLETGLREPNAIRLIKPPATTESKHSAATVMTRFRFALKSLSDGGFLGPRRRRLRGRGKGRGRPRRISARGGCG